MTALARLASALLQGSLALFPPRYRREYGEERACVLQLALVETTARGPLPLLRFCAREGRDLPLALFQEHWKEWRLNMNAIRPFTPPPQAPLAGRQLLCFLIPFLTVLTMPLLGLIQRSFWIVPILILLAVTLGVAVAGLVKGLPRWALPSLGLALSLADLLIFPALVYGTPGLTQLKFALWTDFMPGRVLYAVILAILGMLPPMLLLIGLALLASQLPALSTFRQRLGQDWTLLPFLLYTTSLMTPFSNDPYRRLEPYQLLFVLILVGGAWPFLRAWRPPLRLAALLIASLLAGLVYTMGIYQVYPYQSWVDEVSGEFPRWWESLLPLLDTLVMLVALGLMAVFGARLRQGEPPEASSA